VPVGRHAVERHRYRRRDGRMESGGGEGGVRQDRNQHHRQRYDKPQQGRAVGPVIA